MTTAGVAIPYAMSAKPQAAGGVESVMQAGSAASPLSAAHLEQLQEAKVRAKPVHRCATVATFDGWSVGAFGALTLLFGLFSVVGWVLGGGMILVAYVELSTVPRIRRFEAIAARRLGWNQLALGSLLLGYAGWSLYTAVYGPDPLASTLTAVPEAADMLAPYSSMARMISAAVYVCLALVAVFAQGGTALYYFTREKHIRACREQTPGWIVAMQRSGAGHG